MKTVKKPLLLCSGLVIAFFAGHAFSGQQAMEKKKISGDPIEAMFAAHQPGQQHSLLKPFQGTWKADCTFHVGPEPVKSTGTMTNSVVMDGRFLKQEYSGEFMGKKFQGTGYWGFNNNTQTYESVWVDSVDTKISYASEGTASSDGKTFTNYSMETDPASGAKVKVKQVTQIQSPSQHTYKRYMMADGGEQLSMEITYTKM